MVHPTMFEPKSTIHGKNLQLSHFYVDQILEQTLHSTETLILYLFHL